jgi:hypothetical protein
VCKSIDGGDSELSGKKNGGFSCRILIGWFLILWGLTFLFSGVWGLNDVVNGYYTIGISLVIEIAWDLVDLILAGILAMIGINVLRGKCFSTKLLAT